MWVIKKKDKYYMQERVTDPYTGLSRYVSVSMKSNTAASRKEAGIRLTAKINQRKPSSMRLGDLIDRYLLDAKKNLKLTTYQKNASLLKSVNIALGDPYIDNITAGFIRERLLQTGKSNQTLNNYLNVFKIFLRWSYKNDYLHDLTILEKMYNFREDYTYREKIKDKYLEPNEINMLIDSIEIPLWKLLTRFLVLSGLRIGEAAALNKSDITDYIHVRKTYDYHNHIITTPKTADSIRDVYIQPELRECINDVLALCPNKEYLFYSRRGNRIHESSYCEYLLPVSMNILGRHITPHVLRHTHTSLLAASGVPLEVISRRLGHHDSNITKNIYLHVTEQMRLNDNAILDKISLL